MARIVVTGGTGFVGCALLKELARAKHDVLSLERGGAQGGEDTEVRRIFMGTDWSANALAEQFSGADTVMHLASRNHHVGDDAEANSDLYKRDILDLTEAVVEAVKRSHTRRLIVLSSIKARDIERTDDPTRSIRTLPYAYYKWAAERCVAREFEHTNCKTEAIVLRPPLVYDLEAKGNFGTMVKLVRAGLPIPMPVGLARRALLSRDNLVSCLVDLADPNLSNLEASAANVFEIHDGHLYTLADQFKGIGAALGKTVRILPVPGVLLGLGLKLINRSELLDTAREPLSLSNEGLTKLCGWTPQHSWLRGRADG